jgi:Carboxypeptidase regulatory-like domain
MRFATCVLILIVAFTGVRCASAQETTGTITGRVTDSQGLPVPGVAVTATGPQGVKTAVSGSDGRFTVPFVTPGAYAVRLELQGFRPVERRDIAVRLGQTVDLPITMDVGGVNETVTVTAAPPLIDPTSTTAGAVISSDLLERVPVGRRISDTLSIWRRA